MEARRNAKYLKIQNENLAKAAKLEEEKQANIFAKHKEIEAIQLQQLKEFQTRYRIQKEVW